MLSTFLKQFYAEVDDIPREILLPSAPDDSEELEDWLSDKRYEYHVREGMDARCGRVHFVLPQIGEKAKMIRMVEKNAQISIDHYKLDKLKQELNNKTLDKLAACLGPVSYTHLFARAARNWKITDDYGNDCKCVGSGENCFVCSGKDGCTLSCRTKIRPVGNRGFLPRASFQ